MIKKISISMLLVFSLNLSAAQGLKRRAVVGNEFDLDALRVDPEAVMAIGGALLENALSPEQLNSVSPVVFRQLASVTRKAPKNTTPMRFDCELTPEFVNCELAVVEANQELQALDDSLACCNQLHDPALRHAYGIWYLKLMIHLLAENPQVNPQVNGAQLEALKKLLVAHNSSFDPQAYGRATKLAQLFSGQ